MICGDARINGIPVGIIANQRGLIKGRPGEKPRFGGILYAESAEKVAFFIDRCDRERIPILFVQDVSGFMVGGEAEHEGIIRAGARFVEAMATARVPKIVLTVNHASGAGYYAMAGQGFDPDFIFSWPTGRMAVMEGESAVQAVHGPAHRSVAHQEAAARRKTSRNPWPRCARTTSTSSTRATPARAGSSTRSSIPKRRARFSRSPCAPRFTTMVRTSEPSCSPLHDACKSEKKNGIVRVASGQGFWGDWLEAPRRQVEGGDVDYLMLDYLAEVTMSHSAKAERARPEDGLCARLRRRDGQRA